MQSIPAEKVIPGTNFTVDGFRHCSGDVQAYFLSHAHSDHYTGITDNWSQGIIHCSPVTAKLVVHLLGVKPEYLKPLALDTEHHIQGVTVILVDANHCPGAVQFLFELPNGEKYIHCGDMRFGQHLLQNPHLKRFQDANAVFLDTTYCNPKYTFPPQEEAVQYVATTVDRLLKEQQQQWLKRIYVISTYVIGKERLLVAIHKLTGCKIGVTQQKMDTMKCLELPGVDLDEVFTTDLSSTPVHVAKWGFLGESWPFFRPNFVNMEQYKTDMNVDEVVGFVPTGWMYEMKRKAFPVREKGSCFIHLVPYSEHSSYSELREYVRFLKPHKVLPTVGVHADDASGKKSAGMQKHFRHLVNETASKQRFLRSLHRSSSAKEPSGSLPPSVKEEPDLKEEELALSGSLPPKVKEEPGLKEEEHAITDQSGIRHEPSGKGMSSIKQEPSTSTGPGIKQESGAFSCDEFLSILGGDISADTARTFVTKAGGNLAVAINSFYDNAPLKVEEPGHPGRSAENARATSSETSAESIQQGADAGVFNGIQKQAGQPQASKPKTKGRKRGVAAPPEGTGDGPSKKAKPSDAAQRSIAAFFGGQQTSQAGQATPYRHISRAFQAMESTTKRLRIGDAIANMFRSILALSPEDMLQAAYLTIGKLAPDYENVELSVGGSTVAAAVVEATGTSRAKLREMYNELGDLGDVAQACRHTQTMLHRPAPLTVAGVYKTLRQIAVQKGQGSAARRQQAVLGMLRSCREHETKFLVRTLVSNLRVGANWRSVIGAMARAVVLHREGPRVPKARLDAAATAASEAYHVCPNLDILVPALVEGGIDELEKRCALTPGVPLKPMLAKISEGIPDAIKQLKGAPFLAEYKYDGTRAQIHLLSDNSVKVFSRNCEDKTASMPDVVAAIQAAAQGGSTSLVLDAELVAIDRADGNRLKAFQELSTRARGQIAAHQVTMHEFLLESFAGGTEGLMLKALDVAAGYQPSKRSDSWIKLKRDYCEGLRDSLDLVVIGAWQGQGRKVKWFSPFLLAAWDPEAEEYQSVCRCMSGFTDAFYADATTRFKATAIPAKKPYYRTNESPDVWFEPTEVWEIRGADLTISPVHKAAVGHIHPDRGISLRFPRFITSRNDKRPEDASTPDVIVDLYNKQSRRMTSAAEMLANKSKAKTVKGAHQEGASDQEGDDHEDEG
ncbi:hypothetical protein WJX79_003015 [Trebouxia sp. C0005]